MSFSRLVRRTRRAVRRATRPMRHATRRGVGHTMAAARREWPRAHRAIRGYAAGELSWKGTAIGIALSTASITTLLILFGTG